LLLGEGDCILQVDDLDLSGCDANPVNYEEEKTPPKPICSRVIRNISAICFVLIRAIRVSPVML
jgi:hypothetical protein